MGVNRRLFSSAALLGLVLIVAPGCKKKPPAPPPPPPAAPEVRLQVTSISPNTVAPNVATSAQVFGSAFESGATVQFTGTTTSAGQEVRVSNSNTIALTVPALPAGVYNVVVSNPGGDQATLRSGLTVRSSEPPCARSTVYFGFDVSSLDGSAKGTLNGNMSCYQGLTGQVKIEGHADERGTIDYNLALGQRRADAVKRHLTSGGVSASRVNTVSYGEERPATSGSSESAWRQNRRAEILASE
ncbi:MAG: peptidoglycan-associated lipoprotein [Myxococcota bacterium]|jgi:peptidoglycan-associated lipoprotein